MDARLIPLCRELIGFIAGLVCCWQAYPLVQGAYNAPITAWTQETGLSPCAGSLYFLTRHYASRQPEKYSVSLYRDE